MAVESVPTLVFGDAGAVSGNAGCNQFSGNATIGEDTIDFGALANTRMACVDEAATQLETDYLAALDAAATWSIDGETPIVGGRPNYSPPLPESTGVRSPSFDVAAESSDRSMGRYLAAAVPADGRFAGIGPAPRDGCSTFYVVQAR